MNRTSALPFIEAIDFAGEHLVFYERTRPWSSGASRGLASPTRILEAACSRIGFRVEQWDYATLRDE